MRARGKHGDSGIRLRLRICRASATTRLRLNRRWFARIWRGSPGTAGGRRRALRDITAVELLQPGSGVAIGTAPVRGPVVDGPRVPV